MSTLYWEKSLKTSITVTIVLLFGDFFDSYFSKKIDKIHPIHAVLLKTTLNFVTIFTVSMFVFYLLGTVFNMKNV